MDFEDYSYYLHLSDDVPENFQIIIDDIFYKIKKISKKNLKILDFGCGDGRNYSFFKSRKINDNNIYGVEISKNRIDRCKKKGWLNIYHYDDIDKIECKFDLIIFSEVIEHLNQSISYEILDKFDSLLKKNGYILVTTPNYPIKRIYDYYAGIKTFSLRRFYDDPTHINFFNQKKLIKYFKNFKFIKNYNFKNGFIYKYVPLNILKNKLCILFQKK